VAVGAEQKRELLSRVPLFRAIGERQLAGLVPAARAVSYRARQEVFHKGDPGAELFAVIRGRLKALTTSQGGHDVVFSIIGPGEVFGELALLGETARTATVTAIEPCDLMVLDRRDFLAFLRKNPDVAIELLSLLVERLKNLSEVLEDTQFLNLPVRLAKKVTSLADVYGRPGPDGLRVDLRLSQEEWGDLVGATRESINKQMRAWSEEGLIRVESGYVTILRPDALERLARFALI
jgi:CRP-like cAMP-binding protein